MEGTHDSDEGGTAFFCFAVKRMFSVLNGQIGILILILLTL